MNPLPFLLRFAVAAILLATQVRAAVLIPTGSTWHWRPGTTEASAPVTAWRDPGFDDKEFTSAPAPFWYGDVLPGGTAITGMQNVYGCLFLRKTFVVSRPSEIAALRLGALVDDGFVAWINGTEVLRVGMPGESGTAVTTSTLANNAVEPVTFNSYPLPSPPSYLVAGTNILAVQVFQSSLGSSDIGFECSLESNLADNIPPRVLGVTPSPDADLHELTHLTVVFSEPVSGVVAAHLLVGGIGATSVAQVDDETFTFTFTQRPYGPVPVTWNPNHTITDQALPPNRFDATTPGATWLYQLTDNIPPAVAGLSPGAGTTTQTLTEVRVLFSEPVTGVDAADLLINDSPAANLTTIAASQYIFTFPEPSTGSVRIAWAANHGIRDEAPTPNAFIGTPWTYNLDPNATDPLPYISEFMASNTRTLRDEDGEFSDWIEIYNPSPGPANLEGWYLTDNINDPRKWRLPATNLAGGGFLVAFASAKDRRLPGAPLHTSFQLSASGEYLALVRPDGTTLASEFGTAYPQQVPDVSYGVTQTPVGPAFAVGTAGVYFTKPTPGTPNLGGTAIPGPIIDAVQHTPGTPLDHEDLLVTARVLPSFHPVTSVTLRYRIMFGAEASTPMLDDGAHGDGAAGDGVFGGIIPANLSTNGQMIRYLVAATDVNSNASRWPLFTHPTATEEYLGTIVNPTNLTSRLPVFHLFVAPGQAAGVDSESGGRVSFFYDGEFYDNVYMEVRGNTSAGLVKKSHRLEFNRGHELRHAGPGGRTRKSSLLAEYLDPAYLRENLCFWFLDKIGVPSPFHYPVRVQSNGQFYQLAFHTDVLGQEQLDRLAYDPRGALYKAVGNLTPNFSSTGGFQKLEPDTDPTRTDYLELAKGINETSSATLRRNTVFDLLDVPQVVNHLAGSRWCSENDDVWANMCLYRDTFGDGLWRNIPFDMNASWGQLYGGSNPLEATVDGSKSHPLYGGASTGGNFNRLYDVIIQLPETRQMLLRRERSILDQLVQPPGTPDDALILENHIRQMTNLISAEASLDRARWGASPWAPGKTFTSGVADLLTQFVGPRRRHWYVTHSITNTARPIGITPSSNAGIPLSQSPGAFVTVVDLDFNPTSANQAQEYVALTNSLPSAVDLSGWKLDGAVQFTFHPGTVMPSNSVLYVSPDVRSFRARTIGPRGGRGLFVVGPFQGRLSARGETLVVRNGLDQIVHTYTYPGTPSQAQQFLRVTEIMYHPAPSVGSPYTVDEFAYVELKNISPTVTLDLAGVSFTNGVVFSFTGSSITSLAPGGRVLVVNNPIAFAARYGVNLPIAGQYTGHLGHNGERLTLLDASGEEILDFQFNDGWYPITDGFGFSLVTADENADPESWNHKSHWRPSATWNGSPGAPTEPPPPALPTVLVNEILTHGNTPPAAGAIELHNPSTQPADITGWWLTDDFRAPTKFRIPEGSVIPANGYVVVDESRFGTGPAAFGLSPDGGEVWIFSADATGKLTGYYHGFPFGPVDADVSLGRHVSSEGQEHFVSQLMPSFGSANQGPRVGPVVISEIMYHPPDQPGGADNREDEYLELVNASTQPIPLFDPGSQSIAWRLRGGVDFDFPPGLTLSGGEYILLVNFNPTNTTVAAAFRNRYSLPPALRIFGPYSGHLDNSGQNLEILRPIAPAAGPAPYVLVDQVQYQDQSPWPVGADGSGFSLHRTSILIYGNDPAAWVANLPTPGKSTTITSEPMIVTQPVSQSILPGGPLVLSLAVTNTATLPLGIRVRRNGTTLPESPTTFFTLDSHTFFLTLSGTDAAPPWTQYSFVVTNPANPAGTVSDPAIISYLADTDSNGLDDPWELQHFGRIGIDPNADADADGATNRGEYVAGTDPLDPASHLSLEGLRTPPGATIRFLATSNRTYTVQFKDNLGDPAWQKLADIPAAGSNLLVGVVDSLSRTSRLYRLATPRQP